MCDECGEGGPPKDGIWETAIQREYNKYKRLFENRDECDAGQSIGRNQQFPRNVGACVANAAETAQQKLHFGRRRCNKNKILCKWVGDGGRRRATGRQGKPREQGKPATGSTRKTRTTRKTKKTRNQGNQADQENQKDHENQPKNREQPESPGRPRRPGNQANRDTGTTRKDGQSWRTPAQADGKAPGKPPQPRGESPGPAQQKLPASQDGPGAGSRARGRSESKARRAARQAHCKVPPSPRPR